jgi:hypothetical protein
MQSKDWIASKATEKSPKLLKKSYKRGLFGGDKNKKWCWQASTTSYR